jgi:hypothetical protein
MGGKPARRRGPWFGVLLTLALLLCLPLVAYIGLVLYVKLGYLEGTIDRSMSESFGPGANVGTVELSGLDRLSAASLTLPSRDGSQPPVLTAEGLQAAWDPWALVSRKHIRQLQIEKPVVELRRQADGQWNLRLPEARPDALWFEQMQATDATVAIEWAPGRRVTWADARATLTRPEPGLPQSLSFQAQWPSKAPLHGEATLGPGEAFLASLAGWVDLATDLPGVGWPAAPPSGRLTFEFDAQRSRTGKADLTFEASVTPQSVRCPLGPGKALAFPDQKVRVRGRIAAPADLAARPPIENLEIGLGDVASLAGRVELPPADAARPELKFRQGQEQAQADLDALRAFFQPKLLGPVATPGKLQLKGLEVDVSLDQPGRARAAGAFAVQAERLGTFAGRLELVPNESAASVCRLREGQGRLDLEAVRKTFELQWLGPQWVTRGELVVKGLEAETPVDQPAKLKAAAVCSVPDLRLGVPGAGELPPLTVQATLSVDAEGAKISDAIITLGEVGRLVFSAASRWDAGRADWIQVLKAGRIEALDLDLGALLKTEFGRRLAAGRLNPALPLPAESELLVVARGKLEGKDLKVEGRTEAERAVLEVQGLQTSGLEIVRSPLGVDLSAWKLAGTFAAQLGFAGSQLQSLEVGGNLRTTTEPPLSASLKVRTEAGPDGRYALRRVELPEATIPAAELARVAGLKDRLNLTWGGQVTLSDGVYDVPQGAANGLIRFENLSLTGLTIGPFSAAWIKGLTGQARLTWQGGKLALRGRLDPFQCRYSPLQPAAAVPALTFSLNAQMGPDGALRDVALVLDWEEQRSLAVSAVLTRPQADTVRAVGHVETTLWNGVSCDYDVKLETGRGLEWVEWRAGPLSLTLKNVDLAQLARTPLAPYLPAALKVSGVLPSLTLEATPFRLAELKTGRPVSTVTVTGEYKNVNVAFSPGAKETERSEAEGLTGSFRGEMAFESGENGFRVNLMTTLTHYQLLLDPRFFVFLSVFRPEERVYIPPPRAGEKSALKFTGQVLPTTEGGLRIQVHDMTAELPGRLSLGGSGSLAIPADGDLFEKGEGYVRLRVEAPDLERLNTEVLKLNVGQRAPNLRLAGAFAYNGKHVWGADRAALSGQLSFRQMDFFNANWTVRQVSGTLPLAFHLGLWPGEWPREEKGTLNVGSMARSDIRMAQTALAVVASPNVIAIQSEIPVVLPGGTAVVTGARLQDILAPTPSVHFGLRLDKLLLAPLAQAEGFPLSGLEGYGTEPPAYLTGELASCALTTEGGPLGAWNLSTSGAITGQLFEGRVRASGLYVKDCLGVLPVVGLKELRIDDLSLGSLTRMNNDRINKWLGRFDNALRAEVKVDVNVALTDFETAGLSTDNVRRFNLEVRSIPKKDKEYFFSRTLAQWIAGEPVEKVSMGAKPLFEGIGVGMKLEGGYLYYLIPLLPDECIISGIRLEGLKDMAMPGGNRQVKGDRSARKEWRKIVGKE